MILPVLILGAIASQTAVVSTHHSCSSEAVTEEQSGIMVTKKDQAGLTRRYQIAIQSRSNMNSP